MGPRGRGKQVRAKVYKKIKRFNNNKVEVGTEKSVQERRRKRKKK